MCVVLINLPITGRWKHMLMRKRSKINIRTQRENCHIWNQSFKMVKYVWNPLYSFVTLQQLLRPVIKCTIKRFYYRFLPRLCVSSRISSLNSVTYQAHALNSDDLCQTWNLSRPIFVSAAQTQLERLKRKLNTDKPMKGEIQEQKELRL